METNKNSKLDFIIGWLFIAAVAFFFALNLGGCNTVKGFAKDVYSITEGIQNEMANDSDRDSSRPSNWD